MASEAIASIDNTQRVTFKKGEEDRRAASSEA
jgi:hypothetical protein